MCVSKGHRVRRSASLSAFALLVLLTTQAEASPINLVADGGFEAPVDLHYYGTGLMGPWSVTALSDTAGIYTPGSFPSANVTEGNQAFDMAMGGYSTGNSLSQTIATIAGQSYHLTFDWGSEYGWGTYSRVTIGDLSALLIDQPFDNTQNASTWIQHTAAFDFIASGNDVLRFTDLTDDINKPGPFSRAAGLSLDNVAIVDGAPARVPEPALFLLLAAGVSAVAARRRA